MFFFSQNTKPFYHELDFQSPYLLSYLHSISEPFSLDNPEFINKNSIQHLQNIMIIGPDGCGKSTQIYAFISSLFHSSLTYHLKNNIYENSFQYKSSPFHIEFSVKTFKTTDITNNNKNIEFVKYITESNNIIFNIPKIIYIRDFDKSNSVIQKFFLRIFEKSSSTSRFIVEISELSRISNEFKSRFLQFYIKNPSIQNIHSVISHKYFSPENPLPDKLFEHMVLYSHLHNFTFSPDKKYYNMKHIFGILHVYLSSLKNPHMLHTYYIPVYIKKCIKIKNLMMNVINDNFFSTMFQIRDLLLDIFVNNISLSVLHKFLLIHFTQYFKSIQLEHLIPQLISFSSTIDHQMNLSNKYVIFSESFILFIIKNILIYENSKVISTKIIPKRKKKNNS